MKFTVEGTQITIKKDFGYIGKGNEGIIREGDEKATVINLTLSLPELSGSEKQIAWAESIRTEKILEVSNLLVDMLRDQAQKIANKNDKFGVHCGFLPDAAFFEVLKQCKVETITELFEMGLKHRLSKLLTETSASKIIDLR